MITKIPEDAYKSNTGLLRWAEYGNYFGSSYHTYYEELTKEDYEHFCEFGTEAGIEYARTLPMGTRVYGVFDVRFEKALNKYWVVYKTGTSCD